MEPTPAERRRGRATYGFDNPRDEDRVPFLDPDLESVDQERLNSQIAESRDAGLLPEDVARRFNLDVPEVERRYGDHLESIGEERVDWYAPDAPEGSGFWSPYAVIEDSVEADSGINRRRRTGRAAREGRFNRSEALRGRDQETRASLEEEIQRLEETLEAQQYEGGFPQESLVDALETRRMMLDELDSPRTGRATRGTGEIVPNDDIRNYPMRDGKVTYRLDQRYPEVFRDRDNTRWNVQERYPRSIDATGRERIWEREYEDEIRQIEDVIENGIFDPEDGGPQWLYDEILSMEAEYPNRNRDRLLQDALKGRQDALLRRGAEGAAQY